MSRGDVQDVLIFENRGREVGATIDHPHGQIYAFDHVPERTKKRIDNSWQPDSDSTRRFIEKDGWAAWVTYAPIYPVSIEIAPLKRIADLTIMSETDRMSLTEILRDVLQRLDRLYASKTPYMMWINQQPKNARQAGSISKSSHPGEKKTSLGLLRLQKLQLANILIL